MQARSSVGNGFKIDQISQPNSISQMLKMSRSDIERQRDLFFKNHHKLIAAASTAHKFGPQ